MTKTCANPGNCQVILVEDDQLLQAVLSMQLEAVEINFCAASNGHQALALIRSHRPKVLILDLSIGDFSGYDVIETMKNDPSFADLSSMHVLVHTSQDLFQEQRSKLSFGRTQFLTKTLGPDNISDLVSQILSEA